jgi:uncharacterized protein YprB with RNaseH-like and TPR domain
VRLRRWRPSGGGKYAVSLGSDTQAGSDTQGRIDDPADPAEIELSSLSSFDLETTGLSGGAGTVAFLAAFGKFSGGQFRVRQFFMDDYPAEPAFLAAVGAEMDASALVLSYNGASFDLPLYRTRCVLNGLKPSAPRYALDLLHPARRLWRRSLSDCSLGSIERRVLGIERGDDLPGALVPEAYFRFLKEGFHRELALAMDHNAADVFALARLFLAMERALDGSPPPYCDTLGLAFLLYRFDRVRADGLLERLLAGDQADDAGTARAAAAALLMRSYWRQGRKRERLALAPYLPDDARGLLFKSLYEERLRENTPAALACARRALAAASLLSGRQGEALADRARKRAGRLEERRRREGEPGGPR